MTARKALSTLVERMYKKRTVDYTGAAALKLAMLTRAVEASRLKTLESLLPSLGLPPLAVLMGA